MLDKSYLDSVREIGKANRKLVKLEERILYGGNLNASQRRKANRRASTKPGSEVPAPGESPVPEV